jgi:hypothetical protein
VFNGRQGASFGVDVTQTSETVAAGDIVGNALTEIAHDNAVLASDRCGDSATGVGSRGLMACRSRKAG